MHNYSNTLLIDSDSLINTTRETVHTYEEFSGDVKSFEKRCMEVPEDPSKSDFMIYYICCEKLAERLRSRGRKMVDIIVPSRRSPGRDNICITSFVWGEDMKTRVGICTNSKTLLINHL